MSDHPKIDPKDLSREVLGEIAKSDRLNTCPICEIALVATCSQGGRLSVDPYSSSDWNMERAACVDCNVIWSLHKEIIESSPGKRIRLVATSDCYHSIQLLILFKDGDSFVS